MQIFLKKIMTAFNAPLTRISQPHTNGKKISRDPNPADSHMQNATLGKRSRKESEETQPEQSNKKCHFFEEDGHEHSMVEATVQPR